MNTVGLNNFEIVIRIFIVVVIPILITEIIRHLLKKFQKKTNTITMNNIATIMRIIRIIAVIVIFLGFLDVFSIDLNYIFVSLGLVTLSLTIATKYLLSNFIAGITLIVEKPFIVGDVIGINDLKGTVRKIGLRNVDLLSRDEIIIVPNTMFSQNPFINYTKNCEFMQYMKFSLQNNKYLKDNLKIIEDIIEASSDVVHDHKYSVNVHSFDKDDVEIIVHFPINDIDDRNEIVSNLLVEIHSKIKSISDDES